MKTVSQLRRDAFYTRFILLVLSIAFVLYLNASAQEPSPAPGRVGPPMVSPISPVSPIFLPVIYVSE